MKALVLGYFSTIGDHDSLEVVKRWIRDAGGDYTVAPFKASIRDRIEGAIDPQKADPSEYTHVIVVCGPCWKPFYTRRAPIDARKFAHCRFIGINLSMIDPLASWNPFDDLIERDSDLNHRPDLTFLWERTLVPVVGVCLVHPQKAYGDRQLHDRANLAIRRFLSTRELATVEIDTAWPAFLNRTGLRTPAEIEALIARVDVLLTTRLHGMAYALKRGVPVVAVDAIRGGAKVTAQARSLGWSQIIDSETITDEKLSAAFEYCLTPESKAEARACAERARSQLSGVHASFMTALKEGAGTAHNFWPVPERPAGKTELFRRIFRAVFMKK
jgi:hypothetical protein